jgi:hypothetical protein
LPWRAGGTPEAGAPTFINTAAKHASINIKGRAMDCSYSWGASKLSRM